MSVCGCIKRFVHPNYKYTYFLTHLYQAMQTGSICIEFCDADRIEMSLFKHVACADHWQSTSTVYWLNH